MYHLQLNPFLNILILVFVNSWKAQEPEENSVEIVSGLQAESYSLMRTLCDHSPNENLSYTTIILSTEILTGGFVVVQVHNVYGIAWSTKLVAHSEKVSLTWFVC